MRVCIAGCGNQGKGCAGLLSRTNDIEEICLLDRSPLRAERALELVSTARSSSDHPRVFAASADVGNQPGLTEVIHGFDMVVNAGVPAMNIPLMEACIQTGAHYLDFYAYDNTSSGVSEEETIEAQLAFDAQFAAAGLLALPGQGIKPGIADIALKELTGRFDLVDSIIDRAVDWFDSDELLAPCDPQICMEQWLGAPGVVCAESGRLVSCDLVKTAERYAFPPPIGEQLLLGTTHHAPVGSAIEGPVLEAKFANISGGMDMKDILLTAVARQTARHKASDNMLALFGSSFTPTSQIDVGAAHAEGRIRNSAMAVVIEVTGLRQDRRERHTWTLMTTLENSLPLIPWAAPSVLATVAQPVILTLMIARGQLLERGVRRATELDCGESLLREIKTWGVQVTEQTAVL